MKSLLLNSTYQPIAFVSEKKALKLFVKNKIEIISSWDHIIRWGKGQMKAPAIIRLAYYVRWIPKKSRFNRVGVFKRDGFVCMYCGGSFKIHELTIDHVIPKCQGGKLNWKNCVSSCYSCNSKKGDRTPEQAGFKLLKQPTVPNADLSGELYLINKIHSDWGDYLVLPK